MRLLVRLSGLCAVVILLGCATTPSVPLVDDGLTARSAALANRYQAALLEQLTEAMAAGGPAGAIAVCAEAAPAIAQDLSQESGAVVGRTALRLRNPASAAGEPAVRAALADLSAAPLDAAGKPRALLFATGSGQRRVVHYVRAIPLGERCTACHGTAVAPEVEAAIRARYPGDRATGFTVGDLRGAFWIRWPAKS
jgi:hypothetical protein